MGTAARGVVSGAAIGSVGAGLLSGRATPFGIVACLKAGGGLATVGRLGGSALFLPFLRRSASGSSGTSSSVGGWSLLLASTNSSICFLYEEEEAFNARASAIILWLVVTEVMHFKLA